MFHACIKWLGIWHGKKPANVKGGYLNLMGGTKIRTSSFALIRCYWLMQMLRDLRHENVNSFVGACVEPGSVCVITEYCARGSLR